MPSLDATAPVSIIGTPVRVTSNRAVKSDHASCLSLPGFTFFFYSNEGTPREPVHVHVEKDNLEAKFWMNPEVRVAYNDGYDARTLRETTEENKAKIERAWNEFFR